MPGGAGRLRTAVGTWRQSRQTVEWGDPAWTITKGAAEYRVVAQCWEQFALAIAGLGVG